MTLKALDKNCFGKLDSLALKGLVIILMVMHHLFRAPSLYDGYAVNFLGIPEGAINTLFTYFKLCVGVFAFISGYGLAKAYKSRGEVSTSSFVLRRLYKTLLPFWLVFLIVLAVTAPINALWQKTYFKSDNKIMGCIYLLLDLFALQSFTGTPSMDTSWWYMGAAVLFVLAVPLFVSAIRRFGAIPTLLFVIIIPRAIGMKFLGGTAPISFITAALLGVIFEHYNLFSLFIGRRIRCFGSRLVGEIIIFLAMLSSLSLGYILYDKIDRSVVWEISYALVPLTFILFAVRYITVIPYLRGALVFLGKHSANIFLIHTVIREYIKDFLYSSPNFILPIIILLSLSLVGSIVIELIKRLIHFDSLLGLPERLSEKK